MVRSFTLDYRVDDGWYVGKLREVPGVFSQGENLEALKANIKDAYSLVMQDRRLLRYEDCATGACSST